jgi:uncharacterized protein (DUF1499 family)
MLRLLLFTPFLMIAALIGAPVLIRLGLITPLAGFGMALGAWIVGAGAGLLGGIVGIFRPDLRPLAWVTLATGLLLAAALGIVSTRTRGVPIHDITTDLVTPPQFTVAVEHPDNRGRDLTYPHGAPDSATLQASAYPQVAGALQATATTREEVQERVLRIAESLDWQVTWASAAAGLIEAEASSGIFRFVDDVVIRITPSDDGFQVDLRSTSRVGRGDLGANARRILAFKQRWNE